MKKLKTNTEVFHQFQPSVTFHVETTHLFYSTKQRTGFYMKRNTELKRFNDFLF